MSDCFGFVYYLLHKKIVPLSFVADDMYYPAGESNRAMKKKEGGGLVDLFSLLLLSEADQATTSYQGDENVT